jgi:hypothetical protein
MYEVTGTEMEQSRMQPGIESTLLRVKHQYMGDPSSQRPLSTNIRLSLSWALLGGGQRFQIQVLSLDLYFLGRMKKTKWRWDLCREASMIELEGENHRLVADDQTFYCCLCDVTAPFSFVPRIAVKIKFLPTSHFAHQHFQEKLYATPKNPLSFIFS